MGTDSMMGSHSIPKNEESVIEGLEIDMLTKSVDLMYYPFIRSKHEHMTIRIRPVNLNLNLIFSASSWSHCWS